MSEGPATRNACGDPSDQRFDWNAWCERLVRLGLDSTWRGTTRLHMEPPPAPHFDSDSAMHIKRVANGRFIQCTYTWSHEGKGHEGVLLLCVRQKDGAATGAWIDSFHQASEPMALKGGVAPSAEMTSQWVVSIGGTFSAPPDPDWGWRITLETKREDELLMMMYVATPTGEEVVAVRAAYTRA